MKIGNSMIVEFYNHSEGKDAKHGLLVVPQAGQEIIMVILVMMNFWLNLGVIWLACLYGKPFLYFKI